MRGLYMKKAEKNFKILSPRIPRELALIENLEEQFEDEDQLCGKLISNCMIEDQRSEKVNFKQIIFRNVTFKNVVFSRADIEDVKFENCDLSNMDLSGSIIHRVELENCKIVGSDLSDASFQNVVMNKCNGRYANFRFSHCKRVRFKESLLSFADFQCSEFTDVSLVNTDLRECQMSGTKLKGIDMSTCDIDGIGVRIEDVKGAIISPLQAVSLARLLGVVIKDEL